MPVHLIVIPAQAGIHWTALLQQMPVQGNCPWIPACAGMTMENLQAIANRF
jgi:hypothetical protein